MPAPVPAVSTPAVPGLPGAPAAGAPNAAAAFEAMLAALFGAPAAADGAAPAAGKASASAFANANPAAAGLFGKTVDDADSATDSSIPPEGDGAGAEAQSLALAAAFLPLIAPAGTPTTVDGADATTESPSAPVAPAVDASALIEGQTEAAETPAPEAKNAAAPAPAAPEPSAPLADLIKAAKLHPEAPKPEATPDVEAVETASEAAAEAAESVAPPSPPIREPRSERHDSGRRAHGDPASAALPETAKVPTAAAPTPGASAAHPSGNPFQLAARAPAADGGDAPASDASQTPSHSETATPPLTAAADAAAATLRAAAPMTAVRGGLETVASLAAQILKKLDGRSTRFDVQLEPLGLGRVDVRLEVNAQGRLSAAMAFDNPQAAAELRGRAGELTRALEQAGFDVSGGLSFDVAGDHGQSGRNSAFEDQGRAPSWHGRAFQAALEGAASADEAAGGPLHMRRQLTAGVDIKI